MYFFCNVNATFNLVRIINNGLQSNNNSYIVLPLYIQYNCIYSFITVHVQIHIGSSQETSRDTAKTTILHTVNIRGVTAN